MESLNILINATEQEQLAAELPKFTLLYDSIKADIAAYAAYQSLWEEGRKMVREGAYAGDEFDILCDYIEMEDEPDELYPNGTSGYILKHCTLNTEEIIAEKAFLPRSSVSTATVVNFGFSEPASSPKNNCRKSSGIRVFSAP